VVEEAYEVIDAADSCDWNGLRDELGEFFFKYLAFRVDKHSSTGVEPELALKSANRKFRRRLHHVEALLREPGSTYGESTLAEMGVLERSKGGLATSLAELISSGPSRQDGPYQPLHMFKVSSPTSAKECKSILLSVLVNLRLS
jgi:hypothetical protein